MYNFVVHSNEILWSNVVVGRCGRSSGGGVHGFAEVFVFSFGGYTIVESEKVGWIGRWGGAVSWDERDMFYHFLLVLPVM